VNSTTLERLQEQMQGLRLVRAAFLQSTSLLKNFSFVTASHLSINSET
jgi:hypothetical protein